jgi:acyl carrier protein
VGNKKLTLIKLKNIFYDIFEDEDLTISEETSRKELKEWDSVAHVKLVLTIEDEFNMRFTTEEVASIKTVSDFIGAIQKRQGA